MRCRVEVERDRKVLDVCKDGRKWKEERNFVVVAGADGRADEREVEVEGEGNVDILNLVVQEVEERHDSSKLELEEVLQVQVHHPYTPLLPFPNNPLPSLRLPN